MRAGGPSSPRLSPAQCSVASDPRRGFTHEERVSGQEPQGTGLTMWDLGEVFARGHLEPFRKGLGLEKSPLNWPSVRAMDGPQRTGRAPRPLPSPGARQAWGEPSFPHRCVAIRVSGEWLRVLAEPLLALPGGEAPGDPSSQRPLATVGPSVTTRARLHPSQEGVPAQPLRPGVWGAQVRGMLLSGWGRSRPHLDTSSSCPCPGSPKAHPVPRVAALWDPLLTS